MKIKRIMAFITATILLTSSISVNAKTTLQGKWVHFPFTRIAQDLEPGEYVIPGVENAKWVYENTVINGTPGRAMITTARAATGERALYIFANHGGATEYEPGAKMTLHFGNLTGDGTYTIQFDMYPWHPDYRDFTALNMNGWDSTARMQSGAIWSQGPAFIGSVAQDTYYTYTGTVSTELNPELSFGVWGYGRMVIDNIIIKDSTGEIVFFEDFEVYDEDDMLPDYECLEYGLFKDGEEQDSIEDSTTYTVKTTIVNNKVDDFTAQIIAVLRKDGEMVDIQGSDIVEIVKDKENTEGTEVSTTISLGDLADGEYELSVYLWDGLGTMKIIEQSKVYTKNVQ
ncbi:MAG: hypothetical protein IKY39_00890 [Clostridia bacterium]|nr:hypothetical protein [Clostridia bacterium]